MNKDLFFDKTAIVVSLGTLIASFLLFFSDTNEPIGSFVGAILLAALVYVSYVILRWIYLSTR